MVCVHGVPSSCFLYRKVLGGARRPGACAASPSTCPASGWPSGGPTYDYSWTGLGRFALAAVDALGLERFHLVVHDIGGPVGFELAAAARDRILSLTVLNTHG